LIKLVRRERETQQKSKGHREGEESQVKKKKKGERRILNISGG